MSLISKVRKQDAVWWPLTGHDRYGAPAYGDPREIKVRWTLTSKEVRGPDNTVIVATSAVFIDSKLKTEQGLQVGDMLWLGKLDDYLGDWSKPREHGADAIKSLATTPNLKNSETLLIGYL